MTDEPDLFAPRTPVGVPPEVCAKFEELALDIASRGWKRYSSDAVLHRIRWHYQIDKGNRAFKINDHWSSVLARWFLARHPEHIGFFELRERVDDGYSEAAE